MLPLVGGIFSSNHLQISNILCIFAPNLSINMRDYMKKFLSTVAMLAMMLALCSSTCSGSSDDEDDYGVGTSQGVKTLYVDDEAYYAANCTAEQTKSSGMYLNIRAVTDPEFPYNGHELTVHISPSKVAELKEGDVFGTNKMSVQSFRRFNEIEVNIYTWNDLEGDITIKKITDMEMTIEINDLQLEHKSSKVKHKISGTAVLTSGVYDSRGNLLSFKDAIE